MCGVFGFLLNQPLAAEDINGGISALEGLRHRGPDGSAYWADASRGIFIGHTRLAVLDVREINAQPMQGQHAVLAYNGEIYNYRSLRAHLRSLGHDFQTRGDTEVLLHAWEEWGPQCLDRFDGMFAFALWERTGALHLVTDPFGEKPLYLVENSEGVHFSSEPRVLITHLGLEFQPTPKEITEFMLLGFMPAGRTGVPGLKALEPATHLRFLRKEPPTTRKYWWPPEPLVGTGWMPKLKASDIKQIHEGLLSSLELRLESDVPMGLFLSSGVDSSLIAALLRRELGHDDILGVTVAFPDGVDESHQAALVARSLNMRHQVIDTRVANEDRRLGPALLDLYGVPNDNTTALSVYEMARAARQILTVALSGLGGDELFYGYGRHSFLFKHRFAYKMMPPVVSIARRFLVNDVPWSSRARQALRLFGGSAAWQYIALKNEPAGDLLRALPHAAEISRSLTRAIEVPVAFQARDNDVLHMLPGSYIPSVDRGAMRSSVEVRTPFLSRGLMESMAQFDQRAFVAYGPKWVSRHLLSKYLPSELANLPKRGFLMPVGRLLASLPERPPELPGMPKATLAEIWRHRNQHSGFARLALRAHLLGLALDDTSSQVRD